MRQQSHAATITYGNNNLGRFFKGAFPIDPQLFQLSNMATCVLCALEAFF